MSTKEDDKYKEIEWTDEMKQNWFEHNKEEGVLTEDQEKEFQNFLENVKITSKTVKPATTLHDWMRFLHDMMYYKPGDKDPETLQDVFEREAIIKKAFVDYKEFLATPEGAKEFWDREKYLEEHPEERPSDNIGLSITMYPPEKNEE